MLSALSARALSARALSASALSAGVLSAGALLACAGRSVDGADTAATVAPLDPATLAVDGAWRVGYAEETLEYIDPLGAPRSLRLVRWYPSTDEGGEGVSYLGGLVPDPGSWRDATPAEGPFPVILMSHGSQGYAEAMGHLGHHLASHGWVVLSPDHTGNLLTDGERDVHIYYQRPADLRAVLDHAAALPQADLELVVGLGHSFGGYTLHALAGARYAIEELAPACYDGSDESSFCQGMSPEIEAVFAAGFADPRLRTFVSIGAGDLRLFGADGLEGMTVPGLWLYGELEGAADEGEQFFAASPSPDSRHGLLLGAQHNWIIDLTAALDLQATLEPEVGHSLGRLLALAWARGQGQGEAAAQALLDGDPPVHEALVWTTKEGEDG